MINSDADSCSVCKLGFDVYAPGGGVHNCADCQPNNLERDTVRCNLDSAGAFTSPKGCWDGYVNGGRCSGTCGVG